MKTSIVLCFTLCLVGSNKGMSVCHTLSFSFKTSNIYIVKALCSTISTFVQRWNHFPFKLIEERFRQSVRLGSTSDLHFNCVKR